MVWLRSASRRGALDLGAALAIGVLAAVSLVTLGVLYGDRLSASLTGWQAFVLFVLGTIFLFVEAVIPGFGVFGVAGVVLMAAAIFSAGAGARDGWRALGVSMIAAPILTLVVGRWAIRKGYWKKLTLNDTLTERQGYVANRKRQDLIGRSGRALTALRPSGSVEIDGERIDVVTEGEFIDSGSAVSVVSVDGGRVVVKPSEKGR